VIHFERSFEDSIPYRPRRVCAAEFSVVPGSMQQLFQFMQPISLEVEDGVDSGAYPSIVLDTEQGRQLTVGVPLDRGREVPLEPRTPVRIQLNRPDGIYVLHSRVLARSAGHPSLILEWPDLSERIQRREHVRVGATLPVQLSVRGSGVVRSVAALSTDLSVGGIRLVAPEPLRRDAQVRVTLALPGFGERACEARVLRGGATPDPRREHRYWSALEFVGMLESVREDVTQFIFETQRDLRRKGGS
jgi:c-di-GMP-binding flagellar brake protein YcgR